MDLYTSRVLAARGLAGPRVYSVSFSVIALEFQDFFGYVHTVLHSGYPVRSYALWGRKWSRVMSPNRPSPCWSPKSYLGHGRS